jgi:hypothetical protein
MHAKHESTKKRIVGQITKIVVVSLVQQQKKRIRGLRMRQNMMQLSDLMVDDRISKLSSDYPDCAKIHFLEEDLSTIYNAVFRMELSKLAH